MVYKQDFTNVLDLEINKLEEAIICLEGEIKERGFLYKNSEFGLNGQPGSVDYWVNRKTIGWLKGELASKKEFIFKLKDKKLNDVSELDADYFSMIESYEKVLFKIDGSAENPHDVLRLNYMRDEFLLWMAKADEDPSKKEASVFFFKGIKMALQECGVKVD